MEPGLSARTDRFPTQEQVMTTVFGRPFAPPPLLGQPRQPPLAGFSLGASARMDILILLPLHGLPIIAGRRGAENMCLGLTEGSWVEKVSSSEAVLLHRPLRHLWKHRRNVRDLCKRAGNSSFNPLLPGRPCLSHMHSARPGAGTRDTLPGQYDVGPQDACAPISRSVLHETRG